MDLAESLGMTLRRMRQEMTTDELVLWAARRQLYGTPTERAEMQRAFAGCAIANAMGAKYAVQDFLPDGKKNIKKVSAKVGLLALRSMISGGRKHS